MRSALSRYSRSKLLQIVVDVVQSDYIALLQKHRSMGVSLKLALAQAMKHYHDR